MKKLFLATVLLLATSVPSWAQSFNFGIKGGVNLAQLKTKSDLSNSDNRLGYQLGVWSRVGAAGLYLQPEVYVGSKGGSLKFSDNSNEKISFTTLDVPVLVGTKLGTDKLNLRVMAGPVVSFLIDKSSPDKAGYESLRDYKNQTVGGQAGAGVDLGNISVDLRYEKGFTNMSKSSTYDQKTDLWHLSLGFKIL